MANNILVYYANSSIEIERTSQLFLQSQLNCSSARLKRSTRAEVVYAGFLIFMVWFHCTVTDNIKNCIMKKSGPHTLLERTWVALFLVIFLRSVDLLYILNNTFNLLYDTVFTARALSLYNLAHCLWNRTTILHLYIDVVRLNTNAGFGVP